MRVYFEQYKLRTIGAVVTIIINSVICVIGAFILSGIVNAATEKNVAALKCYLGGSIAYLILLMLVGRIDNWMQNNLAKGIGLSLRNDVFSAIIRENRSEYHKKSVGEYMSVITNDIDMIVNAYVGIVLSIAGAFVTVVTAIISMIYINLWLVLFMMIVGVIYLLLTNSLSKNLSLYKELWKQAVEKYTEQIKDLLSGYEVIRDFDLEDKSVELFVKGSTEVTETKRKLGNSVDNMSTANYVIGQTVVITIVLACAYLVTTDSISVGEMIALVQLMVNIINPLQSMAESINELTSSKNIKNELLCKITQSKYNTIHEKDDNKWQELWNSQTNQICMEDVSFSYDGIHNVLDNVNIKLEHGKKYAIIGESGTGKSSLVGLLMNYYQNYQGKISLNGVDYKKIDIDKLSGLFAVVHQDVVLFDGTVGENITLFKEKNDGEVNWAVENACLETFAKNKGMDSKLSENGSTLSGGERQRISIARALLMNRKILVLDEATSALDEVTATKVWSNVLDIKEQTCVAILHHLPEKIMNKFDCILQIKDGRLMVIRDSI